MRHINPRILLALLALLVSVCAQAQVQFGIRLDREKYLKHEKITAQVTVINNSGSQLTFGQGQAGGRMRFLIFDPANRMVVPYDEKFNPSEGLVLAAGQTKTLPIVLNEAFPLAGEGRYRISAMLSHPLLSSNFETPEESFIVAAGQTIAKRSFGVSDAANPRIVKTRYYEIQSFRPDKGGDVLCLKIYDKDFVYSLQRIGPRVSGVDCSHEVDAFGCIHTLVQVQPKIFVHMVFSNTGELKQFKVYGGNIDNIPYVVRDPDLGTVKVLGGRPMVEGQDYTRNGDTIELKGSILEELGNTPGVAGP